MVPDRLAKLLGGEFRDGSAVEDLAFDGASLDDGPLVLAQPIESCGEESVDRRWNGDLRQITGWNPLAVPPCQEAVVNEHPQHLLDEQGISLGRAHDPISDVLVELGTPEEIRHQLCRFAVVQTLEKHGSGVELAAAPTRTVVEELGAREADEEDRRVADP